jgi:hypothetical protein
MLVGSESFNQGQSIELGVWEIGLSAVPWTDEAAVLPIGQNVRRAHA